MARFALGAIDTRRAEVFRINAEGLFVFYDMSWCLSCIDGYYAARAVGIARRGAVALNARSTWPGVSRV